VRDDYQSDREKPLCNQFADGECLAARHPIATKSATEITNVWVAAGERSHAELGLASGRSGTPAQIS
jgi:hypothetical protein